MPEPVGSDQRYLPGLDGLRAIAVATVVAYHLGYGWAQGGLLGVSYYRWLFVDILVLPKEKRRAGLGTRVLAAAEQEAARRGCIGVWLVSASFQAPDFYARRGYSVVGRLDDYPPGHAKLFLSKRLVD